MTDTLMKEKPIFPLLASMALPMVFSMLVNALYNIVDSFFVAQISEDAMTALSLVYPMQNLINAIAIGFGVGINAQIALHLGAGVRHRADTAATHGMCFSLLHGIVITIVSIAITPKFLAAFTTDEVVIQMGTTYASIAFSFSVVVMAALAFEKIFQAIGRMKLTMIALMVGSICNIVLDPLLIFGWGPFPQMGIAGAALATGIGQILTLSLYLLFYNKYPTPVKLRRSCMRPNKKGFAAVCHRHPGYSEPCASLCTDFFPQWHPGCLLAKLCCGTGHLLQIADFLISAGQRHCTRNATVDRIQLRCRRIGTCPQDLPLDHVALRRHYGVWHCIVPGFCRQIDGAFYNQPGNHYHRTICTAGYQLRLFDFHCFCGHVRRFGRTWKRRCFFGDFPVPVLPGNHAVGLDSLPLDGPYRRVARFLDDGGNCRRNFYGSVSEKRQVEIIRHNLL